MIRYSDELIEEIKNANDIVDVVSQYVTLKRSGRNFFGLCPFHKEDSPSFSVSPDKQIFHCFGCNVGGSVISFVSKIENLDFKESLEMLAEKSNITLPTLESMGSNVNLALKAKEFSSAIMIKNLSNPNAKPIALSARTFMKILAASIKMGCMVEISANGEDEQQAVKELVKLFESGFSEK